MTNQKHLDLDFRAFKKICKSSELNITSEMELVHAIKNWINYVKIRRSSLTINLLRTIRLPLLSDAAKNKLLLRKSVFSKSYRCINYIQSSLSFKNQLYVDATSVNLQHRYCSQGNFNVVLSDGRHYENSKFSNALYFLEGNQFSKATTIATSDKVKYGHSVVFLNGLMYSVFKANGAVSIASYSISENKWNTTIKFPGIQNSHNVCAFMGKIYILGSSDKANRHIFIRYDPAKGYRIRANLKEHRMGAACSAFAGRIFVSGGCSVGSSEKLKTVFSYDDFENKWVKAPDMLQGRSDPTSVGIRNRLYVFSLHGTTPEMYDVLSNKFQYITPPKIRGLFATSPMTIGSKILFFKLHSLEMMEYDSDMNEWSEVKKINSDVERIHYFSSLKIPSF